MGSRWKQRTLPPFPYELGPSGEDTGLGAILFDGLKQHPH